MSNLVEHAKKELALIGMTQDSRHQENVEMTKDILELIEVFSKQDHSGFSAAYCIEMFQKLAKYDVIAPLSGNDDEWNDVSEHAEAEDIKFYQNRRASNVFKKVNKDGGTMAYQIDRYIYREPDGACYVRGGENGSTYYITEWPYSPQQEYIDVPFGDEQDAINSEGQ